MGMYEEVINRFRRLPTPLLVLLVLSRFVFGLGLGVLLASSVKAKWKTISGLIMLLGFIIALPGAVMVLQKE